MTHDHAIKQAAVIASKRTDSVAVYRHGEEFGLEPIDGGNLYAYVQRWSVQDGIARIQIRTKGAFSDWLYIDLN